MKKPVKFILTTLSPLHIGTGESKTSVGEYVLLNGKAKFINQDALTQLLVEKDLIDEYINYIIAENKTANLWDDFFVKNQIENDITFTKEIPTNLPDGFDTTGNNLLELVVESAGEKYIPGSTLKGAIRNILFAKYLLENNAIKSKVEQIIEKWYIKTRNNQGEPIKRKTKLNEIEKEIENIESNDLIKAPSHNKDDKKNANDAINDFYKKIRLVDSEGFSSEMIQIEQARRVHFFKQIDGEVDLLRESVKPDAITNFEIQLKSDFDEFIKEPFTDFSLLKLLNIINEITTLYINFEKEQISKSTLPEAVEAKKSILQKLEELKIEINNTGIKNSMAILRIGKGKTLFFQTILPVLSQKARNQIIDLLTADDVSTDHFPNTRVLTGFDEMFGWIKIQANNPTDMQSKNNNFYDNKIENYRQNDTLIAYPTGERTVRFMLNGKLFENVQLVRDILVKKTHLSKKNPIKVVIQQLTKTGKIVQVKLFKNGLKPTI